VNDPTVAVVSILLGVAANVIVRLLPSDWLGIRLKWLLGGIAALAIVYGVAVLSMMGANGMRWGFWRSVVVGGLICGVIGGTVVGLAWKGVHQLHRPQVKETSFSISMPFNDANGDPIPERYDAPPMLCSTYGQLAKAALAADESGVAPPRPRSTEDVTAFLLELVQYRLLECVDALQNDAYGMEWQAGVGMKTTFKPGNIPPDLTSYPSGDILAVISANRFGRLKDRQTYWRSRQYKVPEGTRIRFSKEGVAHSLVFDNPSLYTLALSVVPGISFGNYGFVPPGFTISPEAVAHTKTYQVVVKGRFEFKLRLEVDKAQREEYTKWADQLFVDLQRGFAT